jgi:mannose-6-phosphate isomerase-like protein (cupin superfamily)
MESKTSALASITGFAALLFAPLVSADSGTRVTSLDEVLQKTQTVPAPARVVQTFTANKSQLQVLTVSKIRLHHHEQEDHVVYVAKGSGKARVETAGAKLEDRVVKPGDIFVLPKNAKHSFEKVGDQDLVLLVVATEGWKPLEDTKFHE